MPKVNIIKHALRTTALGNIFVINLFNALLINLLNVEDAKSILIELAKQYDFLKTAETDPSPNKLLKVALDKLCQHEICPKTNRITPNKYAFSSAKRKKQGHYPKTLYHVTRPVFIELLIPKTEKIKNMKKGGYKANIANTPNALYSNIGIEKTLTIINTEKNYLGNPIANLWLTGDTDIWSLNDPDRIRDKLGLIHISEDIELGVVRLNKKYTKGLKRPNITHAASHMRFAVSTNSGYAKQPEKPDHWGNTVDLQKLDMVRNTNESIDFTGCPEAVSLAIPAYKIDKLDYKFIGKTKLRTKNNDKAHQEFAQLLLNGNNIDDVIYEIESRIGRALDEL